MGHAGPFDAALFLGRFGHEWVGRCLPSSCGSGVGHVAAEGIRWRDLATAGLSYLAFLMQDSGLGRRKGA